MSAPLPDSTPLALPISAAGWNLVQSYAELPAVFHVAIEPTRVRAPQLVIFNHRVAERLGLNAEALAGETGAAIFAGNTLPPGAAPLAQAYAGHQFGHFATLGDGRAILLGEQITPDGARFDIQLKGSGPTPYSRRGDGRAALGPMLREYIISEAMHGLRIPTTRSLAVAATGETVWRQTALPGAVLTRVAASHIRVGTFEWAAATGDAAALRALVDYTLKRHYPERARADNPALALLDGVIERQAALIAQWMMVGFVHGVMNTDNMALSGETIDYGPCAFIDEYDPAKVFSSIDQNGRYAFGNQPVIAQWNLTRLAETLLPLLDPEEKTAISFAEESLQRFADGFQQNWLAGMRRKLGLFNAEAEDDVLVKDLLSSMHDAKADFTTTFAALDPAAEIRTESSSDPTFSRWHVRWQGRLSRQPQSAADSAALRRDHNPAFIPRNHLVEAALAAAGQDDLRPLEELLAILAAPFDHAKAAPGYRQPSPTGSNVYQTFCGT